ncbi:putative 2OG-Fe(II) oxygenase [Blastomonas sp.]
MIFPGYLWHGTLPFKSAEHRLTVAFDAVPGVAAQR